jgi:hypothetical protein
MGGNTANLPIPRLNGAWLAPPPLDMSVQWAIIMYMYCICCFISMSYDECLTFNTLNSQKLTFIK